MDAWKGRLLLIEEDLIFSAIWDWADIMVSEIEESLAKHAKLEELYPE
jgi:hypothetical protein